MIFSKCKIVNGLTTVEFDNCLLEGEFITPELFEQQSVITGFRPNVKSGDRGSFQITDYLYKAADPSARLTTLRALKGESVHFYPDKTGNPIINRAGETQEFYVTNVTPIYFIKNTGVDENKLAVIIELSSHKYTHLGTADTVNGYGYQYGQYYGYGL